MVLDVGLAGAVDELHLPGLGVPAHHGRVLRRVVDLQGGGLGHAAAGGGRHQAAVRHVTIVLKVKWIKIKIIVIPGMRTFEMSMEALLYYTCNTSGFDLMAIRLTGVEQFISKIPKRR